MKIIASVVLALSVLAGIAAPLTSANAASVAQQLEAEGRFGHSI